MATDDQIRELRALVAEEDPNGEWDDESLGAVFDAASGMNAAASRVWSIKAGRYSRLVDVSESGSSRKLGDLYKNAIAMSRAYGDADLPAEAEASGPVITRMRRTVA